ncbi:MAG: hypothetical protein HOE11_03130 [Candidatus Diapherotrites archaeon]|jgi:hypothetical protein|nr:hypothetical protein [Candidatus Diapherotrites archaeon]MBT4596705.1 hypothetical protein [Candidatus Diapherotrites archaeon]
MKKAILILAAITISILIFGCVEDSGKDKVDCSVFENWASCDEVPGCFPTMNGPGCPPGEVCTGTSVFRCVSE